ncbi:transposase [Spirosoma sp.]|uniref:transposase n=1 Tax=unclassified Spirosoma TaxID=2621999 RepID=UPI0034259316
MWVCGLIELYFADETGLTMQPYVPYGWQKKGHRLGLPARIVTKRLNLLGLLRLDNQLTVYHSEKALTGQFVVNCLADFVTKDHPKPVVIVLDNGWSASGRFIGVRQSMNNKLVGKSRRCICSFYRLIVRI